VFKSTPSLQARVPKWTGPSSAPLSARSTCFLLTKQKRWIAFTIIVWILTLQCHSNLSFTRFQSSYYKLPAPSPQNGSAQTRIRNQSHFSYLYGLCMRNLLHGQVWHHSLRVGLIECKRLQKFALWRHTFKNFALSVLSIPTVCICNVCISNPKWVFINLSVLHCWRFYSSIIVADCYLKILSCQETKRATMA